MPPVHIQQRQIAQSRIPQTGYGTPTVIAANAFQELLLSDQNLAQYSVTTADNTGQSTRVDFPTDQWLLSHDVQRQFEQQLASAPIGRTLYLLNGSVVTTQPAVGTDPNVYQHVFVPQDANVSRQLPSTSIVEQCGSLLDFLYPSAVAESLSLKGEGINRCTASYG